MTKMKDTFNVAELYLLAASFGGEVLFGLPEKQIYQLKGEEVFEEAHHMLVEKEILTKEGKITRAGAIIIQALEFYHQSRKYVRINNLMFAFREQDEDELIMLIEVEEGKLYRLYVISKAIVLKLLGDRFPFVLREPDEIETTFLKNELSHQKRREIETYEPPLLMNLELFHLDDSHQRISSSNPYLYEQWLIFTKSKKLIMVETGAKKYYHASQYWFLKLLFDEMEFPYKEAN